MIELIEAFLRDLQGIVSALPLYPEGHPRVAELVARVVAHASDMTASHADVSMFQVDGRLVWNESALPGGDTLARGLFATMRAHGFHRLTVRRGLSGEEVLTFAHAVAAGAPRPEGAVAPLRSSAHLHLTALDTGESSARRLETARHLLADQALAAVWDDVNERHDYDAEAVNAMVEGITQTLEDHSAAVLPLAQLKSHDEYTVTHIANVALLAAALGDAVGLSSAILHDVSVAALLHDIGKLRVPADVLNQPGRLTDAQRALVERHPEDGARILLATSGVPDLAVTVAYEHHMHFDGVGGYPRTNRPWKVNLASEMTHIADVFDALRSNRPYRPGMSRDRIAAIMRHDAGTVFDPGLLDVFFTEVVPRT